MDIEPGMIALILMIDPKLAKERKKKEEEGEVKEKEEMKETH